MNLSLDGFLARLNGNLDWHFNYWDEQLCEQLCKQLQRADTILLGGNTYKAMARYWASPENLLLLPRHDIALAELINGCAKVVVTKTITDLKWGPTTKLNGTLKVEVERLKQCVGRNIVILGSVQLVSTLVTLKLIDNYELWVHPILLQTGRPLFDKLMENLDLSLEKVFQLKTGVVQLSYVSS